MAVKNDHLLAVKKEKQHQTRRYEEDKAWYKKKVESLEEQLAK